MISYVQQNKINKINNGADIWTISIRLVTVKIRLSINQVFMQKDINMLLDSDI